MARFALLIAVTLLFSRSADAQHLLAQDSLTGEFHSVDLQSGAVSLVGGSGVFLTSYSALATDSLGVVYSVSLLGQGHSELHTVDPATGQMTYLLDIDDDGIFAMAFGPGDVLYAAINLSYPLGLAPMHLVTIDVSTGTTTVIGQITPAPRGITGMDFDGATMYAWDGYRGLMTVDLSTGLGTDVNPSFLGNTSLSITMCFGDDGTQYVFDSAFWLCEPTTGVSSFVAAPGFSGIFGEMVFIPGPSQVLSLWQTEQVGNPTEVRVRGATPGADIALFLAFGADGSTTIPLGFPCAGTVLNLNPTSLRLLKTITADSQGEASLGPFTIPDAGRISAQLQALDLQTCVTSNPIRAVW